MQNNSATKYISNNKLLLFLNLGITITLYVIRKITKLAM